MYPDTLSCNRSFGMSSGEVMELDVEGVNKDLNPNYKNLMRDKLGCKLRSRSSFEEHIDPSV